jgi:hypothetical protein
MFHDLFLHYILWRLCSLRRLSIYVTDRFLRVIQNHPNFSANRKNVLHRKLNDSGFFLPPMKIDRHHITEILLSMAKNVKQRNKYIMICVNVWLICVHGNTFCYVVQCFPQWSGCVPLIISIVVCMLYLLKQNIIISCFFSPSKVVKSRKDCGTHPRLCLR